MIRYNPRKKFLGQVRDYAGGLWNIVESCPTEYDWPVLLGYPARSRSKGGLRVILTQAIRDYLEQHRMNPGNIRLPLSAATVSHLRDQLGMSYFRDSEQWWRQVKHELLHPELPPMLALLDTDRLTPQKVWPKAELRRMVELAKEGKGASEIAEILGRSESTVNLFCRRFFGVRRPVYAWSAEDKNNLVQWKKQGHTVHEIAAMLGRKVTSVQKQIPLLIPAPGRYAHEWTPEEQQKLIELTRANRSVEEIMESMDRVRNAVIFMQRKLRKFIREETDREHLIWLEGEDKKLKELALAGYSDEELAWIMGRTLTSIKFRCRRVLGLNYNQKQARYYLPDSGTSSH